MAGTGGTAAGAGGATGGAGGGAGDAPDGAGGDTPAGAGGGAAGGGGTGGIPLSAWPTVDAVVVEDAASAFPSNLSGLFYEPAANGQPTILWGIRNSPSLLYRLAFDGTIWSPVTTAAWGGGKLIHYTDGSGSPDSEGVTRAELTSTAIYVSTERDNDAGSVSRPGVLRLDTAAAGTELSATNEWNLVADLPVVDPNLGLEAITWVPDSFLVQNGFYDEAAAALYDPSRYANHGTGLFFVGLEANGYIYAYALDHVGGGYQRVATFSSAQVAIMDLHFDRDVGALWAYCDDTCANRATVFGLGTDGRFQLRRYFDHPTTLPDSNNEGIAIAPEAECAAGRKSFYWADDDDVDGHAIRRGTVVCGSPF